MSAGAPASGLWLRATSQLRGRWRSGLGLALLIGLAGGAVLGAAAGALRISSAYDRLASSADAFTVVLGIPCQDEASPSCADEQRAAAEQVLALPEVVDGVVVTTFLLPVLDDAGRSIQPQEESTGVGSSGEVCVTGSGEVDVIGSADGRLGTELNRHRFVEGRAADPSRADEVVLSVATARRATPRSRSGFGVQSPQQRPVWFFSEWLEAYHRHKGDAARDASGSSTHPMTQEKCLQGRRRPPSPVTLEGMTDATTRGACEPEARRGAWRSRRRRR